jgi:hypothetical protein
MAKITLQYDKVLDAVMYTIEGDLEYSELAEAINEYYKGTMTKYTVWDFSAANLRFLDEETKKLAVQVCALGKARRGGYDLLVVSGVLKYALARVYAVYSELTQKDPGCLKPVIFRTKEDALAWINRNSIVPESENGWKK